MRIELTEECGDLLLRELEPELHAMPRSQIVPICVDVEAKTTRAFAAMPRIASLRGEIDELGEPHCKRELDRLPALAVAAWRAHMLGAPAPDSLDYWVERGIGLRAEFVALLEKLDQHGYVEAADVPRIDHRNEPRLVATALDGYWTFLKRRWRDFADHPISYPDDIDPMEPMDAAEMEYGRVISERITLLLEGGATLQPTPARETRLRAWSRFYWPYSATYAAVRYVRHYQKDHQAFTPSLDDRAFVGRSRRFATSQN